MPISDSGMISAHPAVSEAHHQWDRELLSGGPDKGRGQDGRCGGLQRGTVCGRDEDLARK